MSRSNSLLGNKAKLTALLAMLPRYMKKNGLKRVKEDLSLMGQYINDIVHGSYKEYNTTGLTLAVAAIIYTISPFDFAPDFIPLGLLDDVSIITWAIAQLNEELEKYKERKEDSGPKDA